MILRPLMLHQQQALDWARDRTAIALFMEMRLGKSITSIRWVREHRDHLPNQQYLLVAPLTVLAGWQDELIAEGIAPVNILKLYGVHRTRRNIRYESIRPNTDPYWCLINYEALRSWEREVGWHRWDAVILDESTRIKNPQAKSTKIVIAKLSDAPLRAILTGLPNPEGTLNFFSQMQFIGGGSFMGHTNFWTWRERYFIQIGYDWHHRKGMRQRIKDAVKELAFTMTCKEANVGSQMFYEKRVVPTNPTQRRMWKEVKEKFRIGDVETKSSGAQFVWLQRIAGGFSPDRSNPELISPAKYNEIHTLLTSELKGKQLVVWFNFNEELAYVLHKLRSDGFTVGAILGATPIDKRHLRRKKFQAGGFQVLCVQEALGKFGLDLSAADTEIYYSNSFSYETRMQSQARIVHPRKTRPLLCIDLVTEHTTDEDVIEVLREKKIDAQTFNGKLLDRIHARLRRSFETEPDS